MADDEEPPRCEWGVPLGAAVEEIRGLRCLRDAGHEGQHTIGISGQRSARRGWLWLYDIDAEKRLMTTRMHVDTYGAFTEDEMRTMLAAFELARPS